MTIATRDPLRRPHRELRRLVMHEGDAAPRVLFGFFQLFNARFFSGALADPMVLILPAASPRAEGDYTSRDVHGIQSRIRIAPAILRRGMRHALATLLHEMVHAWAHEVLGDTEPGYKGHGPRFAEKCNAIGLELGFPEVAPKGRGGKARAEHWPDLPDAEDLDAEPLKPRRPKPASEAAGGEDDDGDRDGAGGGGGSRYTPAELARAHERAAVCAWLQGRAMRLRDRQRVRAAAALENAARLIAAARHVP